MRVQPCGNMTLFLIIFWTKCAVSRTSRMQVDRRVKTVWMHGKRMKNNSDLKFINVFSAFLRIRGPLSRNLKSIRSAFDFDNVCKSCNLVLNGSSSARADIKTVRKHMAQDHFWIPLDPPKSYERQDIQKNPKMSKYIRQQINFGRGL